MQILAAETSRTMPWKNGLGSTLELATDAPRADDAWSWRLSIADVPSRAACSTFVGISRVLLVLDGDGLLLERAHGTDAVPMIGSGLRFEGEESIVCAPIGSCVRDVNLMFDRSRWDGVLRLARETPAAISGDVVLVHVPQSSCNDLVIEVGGESTLVRRGETLIASGVATVHCASGELCVLAGLSIKRTSTEPVRGSCCDDGAGKSCACRDVGDVDSAKTSCCGNSKKI